MGKSKTDERLIEGRRISVRQFAIHGATGIVRTAKDPDTPPEAEIEFRGRASVKTLSHEFLKTGTVKELTILEFDHDSFQIVSVTEKEPDPEIPFPTDEDTSKAKTDPADPKAGHIKALQE